MVGSDRIHAKFHHHPSGPRVHGMHGRQADRPGKVAVLRTEAMAEPEELRKAGSRSLASRAFGYLPIAALPGWLLPWSHCSSSRPSEAFRLYRVNDGGQCYVEFRWLSTPTYATSSTGRKVSDERSVLAVLSTPATHF
jgi:hypothetical protein